MSREEDCSICKEGPDPDLRTVAISCGYDLHEAGLQRWPDGTYGTVVCKSCRADLIGLLRYWYSGKAHLQAAVNAAAKAAPATIPYRQDGATVMLTEEEFYERHPLRRPR